MSGHSKWANIKRKKEKTDSQKGKIFTKLGREIAVAVREGGGSDPNNNSRLKDIIAKAKAANMPNDNIQRSIRKAAGEMGNVTYEEVIYEGYAAGGVAVIVEVLTDNRNRSASDIRHLFDKFGNGMGATGCVGWMFDRKGVLVVDRRDGMDADEVLMTALDAGAEDMEEMEEAFEITTDPADFAAVREALEKAGYEFSSAEIARIPQNTVEVAGDVQEKVERLIDELEDNDDVQEVYHNADFVD